MWTAVCVLMFLWIIMELKFWRWQRVRVLKSQALVASELAPTKSLNRAETVTRVAAYVLSDAADRGIDDFLRG